MEERRNDVELQVIASELKALKESFLVSEKTSFEWRNRFCSKLDEMGAKIDNLPSMGEVMWIQKILYTSICIVIPSLISLGIAWGSLSQRVEVNSVKWTVIEPEHKAVLKDIEVLKSGVRVR